MKINELKNKKLIDFIFKIKNEIKFFNFSFKNIFIQFRKFFMIQK